MPEIAEQQQILLLVGNLNELFSASEQRVKKLVGERIKLCSEVEYN